MPFTIEVDFEVYKTLTFKRESEAHSYNDVLRSLLGLKPVRTGNRADSGGRSWVTEGVQFPHGTDFRMKHKTSFHYGKVEDGALVVDGQRFTSVSRAARHVTGNSVNGWILWWAKRPGDDDFRSISSLRQKTQGKSFEEFKPYLGL